MYKYKYLKDGICTYTNTCLRLIQLFFVTIRGVAVARKNPEEEEFLLLLKDIKECLGGSTVTTCLWFL